MPENVSPFTITAVCGGFAQNAKRSNASSAMVLADDMAEANCQGIQITDGAGIVRTRDEFRANLPLVKGLQLRRNRTVSNN